MNPSIAPASGANDRFLPLLDYQKQAYLLAYRMSSNAMHVEDIVQDAYMKAYRQRADFPLGDQGVRLLMRMVADTAKDWNKGAARRRYREEKYAQERRDAHRDGNASSVGQVNREQLETAMGELPPAQRSAISLHYEQGFSYPEAAAILQMPEGTLRSHAHRAMQFLRQRLGIDKQLANETAVVNTLGLSLAWILPSPALTASLAELAANGIPAETLAASELSSASPSPSTGRLSRRLRQARRSGGAQSSYGPILVLVGLGALLIAYFWWTQQPVQQPVATPTVPVAIPLVAPAPAGPELDWRIHREGGYDARFSGSQLVMKRNVDSPAIAKPICATYDGQPMTTGRVRIRGTVTLGPAQGIAYVEFSGGGDLRLLFYPNGEMQLESRGPQADTFIAHGPKQTGKHGETIDFDLLLDGNRVECRIAGQQVYAGLHRMMLADHSPSLNLNCREVAAAGVIATFDRLRVEVLPAPDQKP